MGDGQGSGFQDRDQRAKYEVVCLIRAATGRGWIVTLARETWQGKIEYHVSAYRCADPERERRVRQGPFTVAHSAQVGFRRIVKELGDGAAGGTWLLPR